MPMARPRDTRVSRITAVHYSLFGPTLRFTAAVANFCLRHRGVEREERVAGERLVDDHADDAHHGGAAVVALGVELELLHLGVGVAHPRDAVAHDVARRPVGVLSELRGEATGWRGEPRVAGAPGQQRRAEGRAGGRAGGCGGAAVPRRAARVSASRTHAAACRLLQRCSTAGDAPGCCQ